MQVRKALVISLLTSIAPITSAQTSQESQPATSNDRNAITNKAKAPPVEKFYLEYIDYEQRLHSSSENTELGQKTKLDAAFKYRFDEDTDIRLRLDIDPYKYPDENKTSKFEVRLYHKYKAFEVQADFDVNGDDHRRGATTFGLDHDSKDSFMAYQPFGFLKGVFYPYNFGDEVGHEFRVSDVTRIFYVEGNPSVISEIPKGNERIRNRTIPGFELQVFPAENLSVYAGIGSVSFSYPSSDSFDIKNQTTDDYWEIKEDRAYKGGLRFSKDSTKIVIEHVQHSNAALTGSLLQSASSVQLQQKFAGIVVDLEHTETKAGSKPYNLAKDWIWFDNTNGYNPVYVDAFRQEQNWLGKRGSANMVKLGYDFGDLVPYVAYKTLSRNFIYRKQESAEKLRTVDGTDSHGGLRTWKMGTDIKAGKFVIRPEVETFLAKNNVYSNRADQREYKINNTSYGRKNTVFTLFSTYQY